MSKLLCRCGHIIVDQTDWLPYKASFYRDIEGEKREGFELVVQSFFKAIQEGKRADWIKNYFGAEYPINLEDNSYIFDIVEGKRGFPSRMYQCEKCGRLHVQRGLENHFITFLPENDDFEKLFSAVVPLGNFEKT